MALPVHIAAKLHERAPEDCGVDLRTSHYSRALLL
jgi:hypothetical protein